MSKRPGKNKENLEQTRATFIKIAREEFTKFGYSDASTSRIVEKSGMARGSLYYHFGDKNGLFRAVYMDTMQETMKSIGKIMEPLIKKEDYWGALMAGSHAYLDLCMHDNFRKITLIESQAAMKYDERIKIQEKALLGRLRLLLPELFKMGYFPGHTIETVSIFLYGILSEIGRSFDTTQNIEAMREQFGQAYDQTMSLMKS